MQTIEFRALADKKEWVYGYYRYVEIGNYKSHKIMEFPPSRLEHDVIGETIGMFTGFFDKNGIKIYDGDILQYNDVRNTTKQRRGNVYFDEKIGAWYCGSEMLSDLLFYQNNDEWKVRQNWTVKENQYTVIVGNIHEQN